MLVFMSTISGPFWSEIHIESVSNPKKHPMQSRKEPSNISPKKNILNQIKPC